MARNSDKVMHLFRVDGVLTPEGLFMSPEFVEWFENWAKIRQYCLITSQSVSELRKSLPDSVIHNSEYTFIDNGSMCTKYAGMKWMKHVPYDRVSGPFHMMDLFKREFESVAFFSKRDDSDIRVWFDRLPHYSHYYIDEWKDTALFMKRIMWEKGEKE